MEGHPRGHEEMLAERGIDTSHIVTGRIHYSKLTDDSGADWYGCEIIAERVHFLAKAKETTEEEPKKRRSK